MEPETNCRLTYWMRVDGVLMRYTSFFMNRSSAIRFHEEINSRDLSYTMVSLKDMETGEIVSMDEPQAEGNSIDWEQVSE